MAIITNGPKPSALAKWATTEVPIREIGPSPEVRAKRRQSMIEIQAMFDKGRINWTLTEDEILGYGEDGLPI